jgi:GTP-binding protein LepA
MEQQYIRNFCIIAHIDHGKSTLADRLLESTSTIGLRDMKQQILDSLDLERERGITIKLVPVKMNYTAKDGREYVLNLIDTPGHVDFGYEVSRSLAACEGALLVVDATQGVEAQTLANAYMAVEQGLEIIPVINKIDLPSSRPDYVIREIEDVVGLDCDHVILASAKEGKGIDDILERVVEKVPAPLGDREAPLQAMIFDSVYDNYKGVICYIRVVNGRIRAGQTIRFMATGGVFPVEEVGVFRPGFQPCDELAAGEVGYVVSNIKTVAEAHTGDTITDNGRPAASPLPG